VRRNPERTDRHSLGHEHARNGRSALLGEIKQRRRQLPVMMVTAYGDDERPCASELVPPSSLLSLLISNV
jgi:hypothetical protein